MGADEEVETGAEAEAEADFSPTTLSIGFIGCKKFPAEELPVEICESADGDFFGDNPVVDRRVEAPLPLTGADRFGAPLRPPRDP